MTGSVHCVEALSDAALSDCVMYTCIKVLKKSSFYGVFLQSGLPESPDSTEVVQALLLTYSPELKAAI